MNRKVLFLFLLFLIGIFFLCWGEQVTIGNPASATYGLIPINRHHNYSTYEMLYTAAELQSECLINKIAFYKRHGNPSLLISNVSIYMKVSS
ncbi:MAG TPA: hypothetical protein PKN54_10760, partial [Candidatus Cloacimonas acidaminovorans]|nr:hypothetical protein [Candidatus Cloacimonas acidaminovorans]